MPVFVWLDALSHFLSYFAYAFNLYYPWVAWFGSELNSWPSLHSTILQGDPHASKLEWLCWPTSFKVEGPNNFNCLHNNEFNNYLQVKGPISYLFNYLHRMGPNNCLQVKGLHFVWSYSFMVHMLIYSCMNMLERFMIILYNSYIFAENSAS